MTAITMASPPATIVSSNEQQSAPGVASRIQGWLGHSVSVIGTGFAKVGDGVIGVVQSIVSSTSAIAADSTATASVLRKLDHHVLSLIEYINKAPGSLTQFQLFVRRNVAFIDLAQLCADIHYMVAGRMKDVINAEGEAVKVKDTGIMQAGKTAALAANTGGALLWFNEMGLVSLSKAAETIGQVRLFSAVPSLVASIPGVKDFPKLGKIANAIGELRVFSFLKHTSCLFVTLRALDIMYACFAVDAAQRFMNAENRIKAISAGLDLSSYLAELTLSAIILAGVTNVVGLGVVGATCIGLTASSFLYRTMHDKEIKQQMS